MLQAPDFSLFLILLIFFATLAVLNRFLFAPITAILKERERESSEAERRFAEATQRYEETARRIEEQLSAARREALKRRETIRAEGLGLREEKVGTVRKETAEKIASAAAAIERDAAEASRQMPERVAGLARELAKKVLGREVAA